MSMRKYLLASATVVLATGLAGPPASAQTINVLTAGSQNMLDYITDYLGPLFEEQNPGVTVRAASTGPGAAGYVVDHAERLAPEQEVDICLPASALHLYPESTERSNATIVFPDPTSP